MFSSGRTGRLVNAPRAAHPGVPLRLEQLEGLVLLNATLPAVAEAFNAGNAALVARAPALVDAALGADLPGVSESLADAVRVQEVFRDAVRARLDGPADAAHLADRLRAFGFAVEQLSGTPDGRGDLLRATKDFRVSRREGAFTLHGVDGFDYFDRYVGGELAGGVRGGADVVVRVTLGVDELNGRPTFYLAEDGGVTVGRVAGSGPVSGTVRVGVFPDVKVVGTAAADIRGTMTFHDADADHKLRADNLRSDRSVAGRVDGTVSLTDARFTARLAGAADVTWSGQWTGTVTDGRSRVAESVAAPNYRDVIKAAAVGYFAGRDQADLVPAVPGALDARIPGTDKTVGDFLPNNSAVRAALFAADPGITAQSSYEDVVRRLTAGGIKIEADPNLASSQMLRLARGERVGLLSTNLSGKQKLGSPPGAEVPLFVYGIPGIGDVTAGVEVETSIALTYGFTIGVDSAGFYVGADSHVGFEGDVYAGFYGKLEVLNVGEVKASGGLALTADLDVRFADPTPGDGKLRLGELKAGRPVVDFVVTLEGVLKGTVKARPLFGAFTVNVAKYTKSWELAKLVDYHSDGHVIPKDLPHRPSPAVPTGVGVSARQPRALEVTWAPAPDAREVAVQVRAGTSGEFVEVARTRAADGAFRVEGAEPGARYQARVVAVGVGGESAPSAAADVVTPGEPPPTPAVPRASGAEPRAFTVAWDRPVGADAVIVQVREDLSDDWVNVAEVDAGTTAFRVTGLRPQWRYWARLVGELGGVRSAPSDPVELVTRADAPPTPAAPRPANVWSRAFDLNWDAPAGADAVLVQVRADLSDDWVSVAEVDAGTTAFRVTGANPNWRYWARLVAESGGARSAPSDPVELVTRADAPPTPAAPRPANVWARAVDLNWDRVAGADWVKVFRSVDGQNFVEVGTVPGDATAFRMTDVQPGVRYRVRLQAVSQFGASAASAVLDVTTRREPPAAPAAARAENVWARAADVAWDGGAGADGFVVQVSTDGQTFRDAGRTGAGVTRLRLPNLTPNTKYWVRVGAVNDAGTATSAAFTVRTSAA